MTELWMREKVIQNFMYLKTLKYLLSVRVILYTLCGKLEGMVCPHVLIKLQLYIWNALIMFYMLISVCAYADFQLFLHNEITKKLWKYRCLTLLWKFRFIIFGLYCLWIYFKNSTLFWCLPRGKIVLYITWSLYSLYCLIWPQITAIVE